MQVGHQEVGNGVLARPTRISGTVADHESWASSREVLLLCEWSRNPVLKEPNPARYEGKALVSENGEFSVSAPFCIWSTNWTLWLKGGGDTCLLEVDAQDEDAWDLDDDAVVVQCRSVPMDGVARVLVCGPGGSPIQGAQLRLHSMDSGGSIPYVEPGVTDAKGTLRWGGLPCSLDLMVSVTRSGYAPTFGFISIQPGSKGDGPVCKYELDAGRKFLGRVEWPEADAGRMAEVVVSYCPVGALVPTEWSVFASGGEVFECDVPSGVEIVLQAMVGDEAGDRVRKPPSRQWGIEVIPAPVLGGR